MSELFQSRCKTVRIQYYVDEEEDFKYFETMNWKKKENNANKIKISPFKATANLEKVSQKSWRLKWSYCEEYKKKEKDPFI